MKRLILLIITCYGLLLGYANTDTASDSLLQMLQTLPHDTTRLSTLNAIIKIEQNNYKCIQYSDTLMLEALKLKNDKYASLAAYYHLLYYYNRCEQDSVAKWIVKMEPLVQKSGLWDYFFDARRFQIDLYTFTEQYELAISEANKMKQKALDIDNNRGMVAMPVQRIHRQPALGRRTQSAGRSLQVASKEWQCGSPYLRLVTAHIRYQRNERQ